MRRLFSRTRSVAPFLFSERGSVRLTSALGAAGKGGGATKFGPESTQRNLSLHGDYAGEELSGRLLCDCSGEGVGLNELKLEGATWRRTQLRRASLKGLEAPNTQWQVVDLTGALIEGGDYRSARFNLVSFRDARLNGADFSGATFILCDFSGARFTNTTFCQAQFIGCDFEAAVFESNVDFSEANLSGNQLNRSWIGGANFSGADLKACDFSGCLGARDAQSLRAAGASYRPSRLGQVFQRMLGTSAAHHRRVLGAISLSWALLAIALPGLFFARAISNPVNPDELPFVEEQDEQAEDEAQND